MSNNNNQIEIIDMPLAAVTIEDTYGIPVPKTVVGEWEEVKLSTKSNLVKEIAEKHGLKIVDIPLSAVNVEDTYGIPVPKC